MIGANFTVALAVGHSGVTDGRRLLLLQTRYCFLLLPVKPVLLREGRALQPLSDDLCLPCSPTAPMPIGKPWQMIAVDIFQFPVSHNGNKYLK